MSFHNKIGHFGPLLVALSLGCSAAPTASPTAAGGSPMAKGDHVVRAKRTIQFLLSEQQPVVLDTNEQRFHIATRAGLARAALYVSHDRTFSTVEDASVTVVDANGKRTTLTAKDASNMPSRPGFVLYSDSRVLALEPQDLGTGVDVEHFSKVRSTHAELWLDTQLWGDTIATQEEQLEVVLPKGFAADLQCRNHNIIKPCVEGEDFQRQTRGSDTVLLFSRSQQPGQATEDNGPPFSLFADAVFVRLAQWMDDAGVTHTTFASPRDVSAFVAREAADRHAASDALKRTLDDVLASETPLSEHEKAARIYAFVRDRVRYCAIEVGMGGFIPHDADVALETRYGDCKDKANLQHALNQLAGIKSFTLQVFAGAWPKPYVAPALAGNFNHEIIMVQLSDGLVFADPTSRTTPFGRLPFVDEDRIALPNAVHGADLVVTSKTLPTHNGTREHYALTLAATGEVTGTFDMMWSGFRADEVRELLLALPRKRHAAVVAEQTALEQAQVQTLDAINAAPPLFDAPLSARGTVKTATALDLSHPLLLRLDAILAPPMRMPQDTPAHRQTAYFLGAPRVDEATATLRLPDTVRVVRLPAPFEAEDDHVAIAIHVVHHGNALEIREQLVVKKRTVAPADYASFFRIAAAARRAAADAIALTTLPVEQR